MISHKMSLISWVSYTHNKYYYNRISIIFLTHIHFDHFAMMYFLEYDCTLTGY